MQTIKHKFHETPLPSWECKTLILGTFNPEKGSNADYYYGRLRKTGGWSNRFWPAINSCLKLNCFDIPYAERGVLDSKIRIMTKFKFGCIDIVSSVDCINEEDITGNGFPDSAIFNRLNKVNYNTDLIIDYINKNSISIVISSFGIGSSLNKQTKQEIDFIIKACPKTDFQLFVLPAFGRPMMTTEKFGSKLFEIILQN